MRSGSRLGLRLVFFTDCKVLRIIVRPVLGLNPDPTVIFQNDISKKETSET